MLKKEAGEYLAQAVELGKTQELTNSLDLEKESLHWTESARMKIAEGDLEGAQKILEEVALRRMKYANRKMKIQLADIGKQEIMDGFKRKEDEIRGLQ